ncbi:MAG: SurA N-terminal domain-containing protein [Bacteroidales bacterium]|nr:SurA N-terminal domain-containing protein [Bacteroidales bacterium]MBR4213769.1 SurA N-terminal domain-containing protein [Bacteroidales bacterium]
MAALQSIRNRGKLIAIAVGAALLAFILGDFLNSSYSIFGQNQFNMGEINGESISYQDFMEKVNERETFIKLVTNQSTLSGDMQDQIREYVWEDMIRENVIGVNAKKLGIAASDDELINMIQTGNVTQTIRQMFANPQTGMYDPSIVMSFLNDQRPETRAANQYVWDYLERELRQNRISSKYFNMIASGLCVTTAEVEQEFADRTTISDVKFVSLPYSDIKDEEVSVSEAELNQYYNQHLKNFERDAETRDVNYVAFDVLASQKDSAYALDIINGLKNDFASTNEVVSFINSKSDVQHNDLNYNKGEITDATVDSLMFAEQPGFVYGPYIDEGYYKVARLLDIKHMPDSVKVSHILVGYRQGEDTTVARHKADSLLTVIKSGIDFGALAKEVSDDQGSSADSGNLGWFTDRINFIPEFKDACFATEKGQITTVATSYGVHIIKVFDKTQPKKKVNVGFLQIEIKPSNETRQQAYAKASKFAANTREVAKFSDAANAEGLSLRVAPGLTSDTRYIPGIANSREFVRWAFDEEKSKEVSDVMEFDGRLIVAAVVGIHPKGIAPLSAVKSSVESEVIAQKKGEKILADLQSKNVSNVDALAAQINRPVQDASNISLSSVQMGGNYDPAIVAVAASLDKNQVSKPVAGKTAVYVIQNVNKTPAQPIQPINVDTDRNAMQRDLSSRAGYQAYNALIKMANIVDQRYKFF